MTGVPIKFLGVGEKVEALDPFYPVLLLGFTFVAPGGGPRTRRTALLLNKNKGNNQGDGSVTFRKWQIWGTWCHFQNHDLFFLVVAQWWGRPP